MNTIDLLITNANVITLDQQNTRARSVSVSNGRITNISDVPEPSRDATPICSHTKIMDLKGATLIPGFIDTHNHLLMYSQSRKQANCSTPPNRNIQAILDRVEKLVATTPKGGWIMGWGYDNTLLEEKRHPTRKELDRIAPDHPVLIRHISTHFAVANSKALEAAGIDETIQNPHAGFFGRDEDGYLNGVLHELPALAPILAAVPAPSEEELASLIGEASKDYLAEGITTSSDAGVGLDLGIAEFDAHLRALARGNNPLRMRLMVLHHLLNENGAFKDYSAQQLGEKIRKQSNNRATLDSAKLFQDGSIQGLTAALRDPYYSESAVYGELLHHQDDFNAELLDLHNRGFRITIHGNGDRAIGSILDGFEHILTANPHSDHRHRIEHVQTATLNDLNRMNELNVKGSFFINHVYYWGDRHKRIFLGEDRAKRINPLADASERDILYTLHSDCPITPISPLFSIWVAVNRQTMEGHTLGEDQCISAEKALETMTIDGAKLNFDEANLGSIEVGKIADFAVLESDPTTVDPMEIKAISVQATIIGGEVVYSSN
ncbi:putative amidohydrolase YtcJ [Virgibacillus natechei]|uniref:Amidohydrolase YtcJ n=1 Tax=Virgibacillus natechei TaxID=1216297 RepID=A0ABS4IMS2_9BACI|nr:amidohydrolase [Virgibacillus natechei]MBP1971289.1 putative amidohydrolase YtcJ [Virgibacillus natechei]UZD12086.1 amidohydrolase [Virgibacillus natechei]